MTQSLNTSSEFQRKTISLNADMLVTQAINITPLTTADILAGTTLAESSLTIGGDVVTIQRPAENGDDRSGILMQDILMDTTVATPPVQADLKGRVMGVHGVFKTANITYETVTGTLQSETIANTNLIFK